MAVGKNGTFFSRYGTFIVMLGFIISVQLAFRDIPLLSWSNLRTVAVQATVLGLTSIGLSIVMMCGEIDLSFAGSLGLVGTLFAGLLERGVSEFWSALAAIGLSLLVGILNGFLVGKWKYSSFLATISTMFIMMGLQRAYTDGLTIWIESKEVLTLATMKVLHLPFPVVLLIVVFLMYFILIDFSKPGFKLKVIGENAEAAKEVGINTKRIIGLAFVFAALCYGLASVIETIRVSGAIIYSGQSLLLPAIAACFLGTSMFVPGKVNVIGTLVSVFFLSVILNFLVLLGVRFYYVPLIQGLLLLIVVSLSTIKNRSIKQVRI